VEAARCVIVRTRFDADQARREARQLATTLGFNRTDAEAIAIAASELAMNLQRYAPGGEIRLLRTQEAGRSGLAIESQDTGPGIVDVELALQDGYTTGGGLGSGLPAVRRLMDEFTLKSSPRGTSVVATKWLKTR
jgi:serine/threonine-protein kinase RsbT